MKKSLLLLCLFVTPFAAIAEDEINILFFGNSFTFRHELPDLVKEVFEEGQPGTTVNVKRVTYGGRSMFDHYTYYFSQTHIEGPTIDDATIIERRDAIADLTNLSEAPPEMVDFWQNIRGQAAPDPAFPAHMINAAVSRHQDLLNSPSAERPLWDYVVLQTWQDDVADLDAGYAKYARLFAEIAQQQGTQVILYFTAPAIQNQPSETPLSGPRNPEAAERAINLAIDLALELKPKAVVHVPLAINRIQQGGTDLTFRYDNDMHPNQRTAFLTANLFYAAFFGESTECFSFNTVTETNTTGEAPNLLDPDGNPATLVFEEAEKTYLQQMAFDAAMEFNHLLAEAKNREVKILTIGNSFAVDAVAFLEEITESVPGFELLVGTANRGGHSLEMHRDLILESEADPLFKPYGNNSLKDLLLQEDWDVVTIQQLSSLSFVEESYYPFADEIVAHINEHDPYAEVVIHQTWTYAADSPRLPNFGITQEEMHEGLTAAYNGLSEHFGGMRQLKSGEAFFTVIENHPEIHLWRDGFHANTNGRYLAGLVWFSELFDRSAREVTFVPEDMDAATAETLREVVAGLKPIVRFTVLEGDEQVRLNWADVADDDFIHYRVYRGTERGVYGETPLADGLTESQYVDTDVVNGVTYYYAVTAVFTGDKESNPSTERAATPMDPLLVPPGAPRGFRAVAGIEEVLLEWADNTESDLAYYNLYRRTEGGVYGATPLAEGLTASEYVDTSVADHMTYYYVVTAVNVLGNESAASVERSVTFGPPAAPRGFRAAPGNEWVRLAWDDNVEVDLASYTVYRGTESGVYDATPLVEGLTVSEFRDEGVVNDTTYYYVVTAVDLNGNESETSAEVAATPTEDATYIIDIVGNNLGQPSGDFADYSSLSRNAHWGDSTVNDGLVELSVSRTGFDGQVSITGWYEAGYGGPGSEIVYTKSSPAGQYSASNASEAIAQRAFIAIKLDSTGLDSDEFVLEAISVQQWRDFGTSATNFQLAYDANSDGYDAGDLIGSPVFMDQSGAIHSFEVSSALTTAFRNQHEVRLYYWGQPDTWSAASVHLFHVEAAYRLRMAGEVMAPMGFTAAPGIGQATLAWDDSTEENFASYNVYRGTESGTYDETPIAQGLTVSAYVDEDVLDNTTYYYVVTAVDTDGNESLPSVERSVTFGPPATPTGLKARPGNAWVRLDWDDNTEAHFASYNVYRGTESGSYAATPIAQGLTVSEFVDPGLVNDTTYFYVVTAVSLNAAESAMSVEVAVTPIEDATYIIDIVGNTTGEAGGEFADYSSLSRNAEWADSIVDDGVVELSVSRTGFNGDVSLTRWYETAYVGPGTEILYSKGPRNGPYNASTASDAIEQGAFIAIKLDSTGLDSAEFTIDAITVQQWRDFGTSATNFQFAYDADGDGYDTGDLIGSPAFSNQTGASSAFELSSTMSTAYATQHEVRLYYWGNPDTWSFASVHLFHVEVAYRLKIGDDSPPTVTSYLLWVDEFGGVGLIGGPADDYGGYGVPNLLRYALGQNPLTPLGPVTGHWEMIDGEPGWVVTLNRFDDRGDVDLYLLHSTDLSEEGWEVVAQRIGAGPIEPQNGAFILSETGSDPTEVELFVPFDPENARNFFKWRAEQP